MGTARDWLERKGIDRGSQWSNEKAWPDKIQWILIMTGAVVGGATQLLSYLSGSYSDYIKGRTDHGDTTQVLLSKFKPSP